MRINTLEHGEQGMTYGQYVAMCYSIGKEWCSERTKKDNHRNNCTGYRSRNTLRAQLLIH